MKKTTNYKMIVSIILNIIIVITEIIGTTISAKINGITFLKYYTVNSNILAFFSSTLMVVFTLRLIKKKKEIPLIVRMLKYITAICLTVTFVVVVAVLAPMHEFDYKGYLLEDDQFFHHLLCPVLAFVSYVFFENNSEFTIKNSLVATLPTLLYAIIAIILNATRLLYGPYPFLHIYEQPVYMSVIWFFVIILSAFLFALLINFLNKKCNK